MTEPGSATGDPAASAPPESVDVLTFGETMLALRVTATGRLAIGGLATTSIAGAESNAAIGLARLGHRVRWVGRVGDDPPGQLVLRTLRAENVRTAAVIDPDAGTGLILFERRLPQVTSVTYWRAGSAGSRLTVDDLRASLQAGARILLVSGVTAGLGAEPADAVATALVHARGQGWTVCLDVNYRARLWDESTAHHVLAPLALGADVLIGSPDEVALVAPGGRRDAALDGCIEALLDAGVGEVVVKLGAAGARRWASDGQWQVAALSVPVLDPIGAGDAFTAGYLSGLLDGLDPAARLRRANGLGACAVASSGDWEGLPYRADLALLDLEPGTAVR